MNIQTYFSPNICCFLIPDRVFFFCVCLIRRLFGYGIGIHLLEAENPEKLPKKKEINPKDNHISFQVRIIAHPWWKIENQLHITLDMILGRSEFKKYIEYGLINDFFKKENKRNIYKHKDQTKDRRNHDLFSIFHLSLSTLYLPIHFWYLTTFSQNALKL